jgi:hypothetical protein
MRSFLCLLTTRLEKVATLSETMIETTARLKDLEREDAALQREVEAAQRTVEEKEAAYVALLHTKEERDVTLNTLQEALLSSQVCQWHVLLVHSFSLLSLFSFLCFVCFLFVFLAIMFLTHRTASCAWRISCVRTDRSTTC